MRRPPSANERKIIAVAVLALLLWLGWTLVIDSGFAGPMAALQDEEQLLQVQHQRYARLIAQGPALHSALQSARLDPGSRDSLLPGGDLNGAAADLMQLAVDRVKQVASAGPGCVVSQRMPIVPEQDAAVPYRQVKVSLTLDCASEPLLRLLHGLEYRQPTLLIEALNVQRSGAAASAPGPGRLKVQLLLRGYLSAAASGGRP